MAHWKLASGILNDGDAIPVSLVDVPGIERPSLDDWEPKTDCYYPGDTFESTKDLNRHNLYGQPPKIEKLAEAPDGLDGMTVEKLQQLAIDEEMDIPSGLAKPKLIQAIRAHQSLREAVAS